MSFRDFRDLREAEDIYKTLEIDYRDRPDYDIVLVKTDGTSDLRKAYPNYFADTADFVKELTHFIRAR
jgi:hypothetical protein